MPTPSDATRFATRPTPGWWDDRVRAEYRYTLRRIRTSRDSAAEWAQLERRLLSLCRLTEHPNPAKEPAA